MKICIQYTFNNDKSVINDKETAKYCNKFNPSRNGQNKIPHQYLRKAYIHAIVSHQQNSLQIFFQKDRSVYLSNIDVSVAIICYYIKHLRHIVSQEL